VSYVAKAWCRGHVDYDDFVILPIDESELPEDLGKGEPARSLEYRYNWKAE
jgi:hypothetical protein